MANVIKTNVISDEGLKLAINYLQEYIIEDRRMRASEPEKWTDYDKFCENHCKMIEIVLKVLKGKEN